MKAKSKEAIIKEKEDGDLETVKETENAANKFINQDGKFV